MLHLRHLCCFCNGYPLLVSPCRRGITTELNPLSASLPLTWENGDNRLSSPYKGEVGEGAKNVAQMLYSGHVEQHPPVGRPAGSSRFLSHIKERNYVCFFAIRTR